MERKHIDLVIFDMAGTTVFDADFVNRALFNALQAAEIEVSSVDINKVMGYPKMKAICLLLGMPEAQDADLLQRAQAIHDDFIVRMNTFYKESSEVREIEGATEVFQKLRASGIKVALNTGFSRSTADIILDRLHWHDEALLNTTLCSDEVPRGRPHPDMIQEIMKRLAIDSAQQVAKVGDTPSDLQEGHSAGCALNIGVTYGTHRAEALRAYPHTALVDNIHDIVSLIDIQEPA